MSTYCDTKKRPLRLSTNDQAGLVLARGNGTATPLYRIASQLPAKFEDAS